MKTPQRGTWLLLILASFEVRAFFFITPNSTNVILSEKFTIECATLEEGYILSFGYILNQAPPGYVFSPQNSDEMLQGGGRKLRASFIITEELNMMNVTCSALRLSPRTIHKSKPATIYTYALPDHVDNISACQLDHYVFISWSPVMANEGIDITYRITDNKGSDIVTSNTYYSFDYNSTEEFKYTANFSIIAKAPAANQISYRNASYLAYKLNGTIPLNLKYDKDLTSRSGEKWRLFFQIKLHHLNVTECTIDEETLKNATLVSCNGTIAAENCINSTSVNYIENHHEINSTNHLSPRQRYSSTLCFPYFGREIISQQVPTSTHDIQYINITSPDDTSLCLRFHLIHHYQIKDLSLYLRRDEEIKKFNVPVESTSFEWCADTIPASSSKNSGNWLLFACDGHETECTNPAVILNSISLNVVFPTASSIHIIHNTNILHTTTSLSSYLSTTSWSTVSSSLILSPSNTKSSQKDDLLIGLGIAGIGLIVLLSPIIMIMIVLLLRNLKKVDKIKTSADQHVKKQNVS